MFRRPLAKLTRELLRYDTLPGSRVRELVAEVDAEMAQEVEQLQQEAEQHA